MMARPAGSKNAKPPKIDPLLAALIDRLPPPNNPWSVAGRAAWLEMMERAFDVVYGGPAGGGMADARPKTNGHAHVPVPPPAEPDYAFYIDKEGFARMAGGERIDATQVDGILHDMRGEGDLGAIVWADGTRGVIGKVLDIRPA